MCKKVSQRSKKPQTFKTNTVTKIDMQPKTQKKKKRKQDEHLTGITGRHHIHNALGFATCRGIHT